MNTKF